MSVNNDDLVEDDETFTITLSSPDALNDTEGTITIIKNDGG